MHASWHLRFNTQSIKYNCNAIGNFYSIIECSGLVYVLVWSLSFILVYLQHKISST